MKRLPKKLGELLMEKGLITQAQLDEARAEQARTKEFLGAILIKRGYAKEGDLLGALSAQFQIPYVSVAYDYIDWRFVSKFSTTLIMHHKCCPIKADEYTVTVAITNPLDAWALEKAEEETRGYRMKLVLISQKDMDGLITRYKDYLQKKGL